LTSIDASERRSERDAILEVRQRCSWTVEEQTDRRRVVLRKRRRVLATSDGQAHNQTRHNREAHLEVKVIVIYADVPASAEISAMTS